MVTKNHCDRNYTALINWLVTGRYWPLLMNCRPANAAINC